MPAIPKVFASLLALSSGLASQPERVVREALQMGTTCRVEVEAGTRAEAARLAGEALDSVDRVEELISEWRPTSEVSALARHPVAADTPLSPELAAILEPAIAVAQHSGWRFDPAIGALTGSWGIHDRFSVPDPERRAALGHAIGARGIVFDGGARRACRDHPEARLDTGGFGKGAALDEAAAVLRSRHVDRALLDLGGQLMAVGGPFEVAIADPRHRDRAIGWVEIRNLSISTSGNSERAGTADGQRIGHILDPRAQAPAIDLGSVTVIAPSALLADALSTALFVLGPEAGIELLAHFPGSEALFLIDEAGQHLRAEASSALAPRINWYGDGPAMSTRTDPESRP